jgi:long-chain-fatty-acid--CoA ligase ACSBG
VVLFNCYKIMMAKKGAAAAPPKETVPQLFAQAVKTKGRMAALRTESPCPPKDGPKVVPLEQWKTWTLLEYYNEVKSAAKAFMALGLQPKDAVAIYGFNSPEWFFSELGAIQCGGIAAGIYPTDTAAQMEYKTKHSGAVVACVETIKKAELFVQRTANLPKLKAVVVWGEGEDAKACSSLSIAGKLQVLHWSELASIAAGISDAALDARVAAQKPNECCAYIYTSGTTGSPKAVMITHDNIIFESRAALMSIGCVGLQPEEERIISYLPLSHVAGMMVDIVCPLIISAEMMGWTCVCFARTYDLKESTIADRFRAVRPTMFLGVPRVWEKIQAKMLRMKQDMIDSGEMSNFAQGVSEWGKRLGAEYAEASQMGGSGSKDMFYGLAETIVHKKVKTGLGLDQCKYAFTGAAPIQVETLKYFASVGIWINEVYGMSECTGAATWSTDAAHVWGSCGWAVPGVEVKVFATSKGGTNSECPPADDLTQPTEAQQGEICYRGRNIMMGYLANPDMGKEHMDEIARKTVSGSK